MATISKRLVTESSALKGAEHPTENFEGKFKAATGMTTTEFRERATKLVQGAHTTWQHGGFVLRSYPGGRALDERLYADRPVNIQARTTTRLPQLEVRRGAICRIGGGASASQYLREWQERREIPDGTQVRVLTATDYDRLCAEAGMVGIA